MEQSINDSISHIRNSIHPHVSVYIIRIFVLISGFLAESLKANKLAKKKTHFTIQLQYTFHFTNLNSLNMENNMLARHSQKPL